MIIAVVPYVYNFLFISLLTSYFLGMPLAVMNREKKNKLQVQL